ncbi:MAG: caspase family protein [Planctomycetes bacterium]|nr:caspase family protein [Planctomycetota bacterium]
MLARLALLLALFQTSRPAAPRASKVALLVGIDTYAPGTPAAFAKLGGCVADARRARALLVERFGFAPEDVVVLENERATHAGILQAFRSALIDRAGPDTEAVFWFSGHGSRVPDASGAAGAEPGHMDSTFLAWDSRADGADGAWDVCDDELRSLLWALTRKTARVTVVTDACHSDGTTRGSGGTSTRAADDGRRPLDRERLLRAAWPAGIELQEDGDARTLEADRYVHVAACLPHQLAQEIEVPGTSTDGAPERGGALSLFLLRALDAARPGATYREIVDDAAVQLAARVPSQQVAYEGALSRQLFGAAFAPRPPGFLARATANGAWIGAGTLHGLAAGSRLVLRAADGAVVGRAEIATAGAVEATARWCDPPPSAPPAGALRALEESRPAGRPPLVVRIEAPAGASARAQSLRGALAKDTRVALADDAREAYRLALDARGAAELRDGVGLRLWTSPAAESDADRAKGLDAALRAELRHQALVALAGDPGALRLACKFRAPTAAELASFQAATSQARARSAEPRAPAAGAGPAYAARGTLDAEHELSLAMLEVTNATQVELAVSVLSVTEARSVDLVWPHAGASDLRLGAGETLAIPVNVTASKAWPLARPMRDRYLVVATTKPVDLAPLVSGERLRDAGALPGVLELARAEVRTRGARAVRLDGGDWGVATVDLLVTPARD